MSEPTSPSRRGVALLVVLATLLVVGAVCASLAHTGSAVILERRVAVDTARSDELRHAAERSILRWLNTEADRVVLPPEVTEPVVSVLHDGWEVDGVRYTVRATAWDQCGMVPLQLAGKGSPLRALLPEELADLTDREIPRGTPPGLDLWTEDVFPEVTGTPFTMFDVSRWSEDAVNRAPRPEQRSPRLGSAVATHNPGPQRRGPTPAAINMNTAPIPLLEAVMRELGRGGPDLIVESRRRGRHARLSAGPTPGDAADRLELSGSSHCWSFRLDVRVGLVERSWWLVYARGPSSWDLVQRLAISS